MGFSTGIKTQESAILASKQATTAPLNKSPSRLSLGARMLSYMAILALVLASICLFVDGKPVYHGLLAEDSSTRKSTVSIGEMPLALQARDLVSSDDSVSYTYTTTTFTKQTTITVKVTPTEPAHSGHPPPPPTLCRTVPPQTVTVTVSNTVTETYSPVYGYPYETPSSYGYPYGAPSSLLSVSSASSMPSVSSASLVFTPSASSVAPVSSLTSSASVASSSAPSDSGVTTRVFTSTILVTASGLVTPVVKTLTSTAFANVTAVQTVSSNVSASSSIFTTATAEGVFFTSSSPTTIASYMPQPYSHPNITAKPSPTSALASYGSVASTKSADFTLTVPWGSITPLSIGIVGSTGVVASTGAMGSTGTLSSASTSSTGTSTSRAGPASTVVVVSSAPGASSDHFALLALYVMAAMLMLI